MENKKERLTDLQMAEKIARLVDEKGGKTFFVGGYVRDLLRGKENKDIDIEIHGIPVEELEAILDSVGKRTEMGASFGIFGLRGFDLDIAMPRKEEATGRGHKDFKVNVDPYLGTYKAALRRDFTLNALMQDVLTGEVVDHFGGVEDLDKGLLRHVNEETFVEDPLRVLRAAQFAARFNFKVADETVELSKRMNLDALAKERIMGELEKALLKANRPSVFFEELRKMNQLSYWFPEVEATIGVPQNPVFHPEGDVWNHTMAVLDQAALLRDQAVRPLPFMLSALFHDLGKTVTTSVDLIDGRVRSIGHENRTEVAEDAYSRIANVVKTTDYILNMTELHMRPNQMFRQKASQKAMNKLFDKSVEPADLVLLAKADHLGRKDCGDYTETENYLRASLASYEALMKEPQVMGRDLIEAGLKPGQEFSELLKFAHRLHLSGVKKEDALKQVIAEYEQSKTKTGERK